MAIAALLRLLAGSLILWEQRGDAFSTQQLLTRLGGFQELALQLFAHIQQTYTASPAEAIVLSRTDVDAALAWLLHEKGHLTDWYHVILTPSADADPPPSMITWSDRQPSIAPTAVADWERLANSFDMDALLTFHLARQYAPPAVQIQELTQWKTVPRVIDHELTVLWSRGLSDLHVHAGGVRVLQAGWQDLMAGQRNVHIFRALQKVYKHEERVFQVDIAQARKHRQQLLELVPHPVDAIPLQATTPPWCRWSSKMLQQERCLLVGAWSKVLASRSTSADDSMQVLIHLDGYLQHKHRYCRLARQPSFEHSVGLRHFDTRYFGVLKRAARSPRPPEQVAFASSPRLQMTALGDACVHLLESESLQRLELRMAPFDQAGDYIRFFKSWSVLEAQINSVLEAQNSEKRGTRHPVRMRFAVHFKRTSQTVPTFDPVAHPPAPEAVRQLLELDRQSAALRAALSSVDAQHRKWMAALARIDVAGQERDTPASLFTLHMRLLRGDPDAIQCLEDCNADHPYRRRRWLQRWCALQARGQHRPSLTEKRLGITVHAGEDFADVLDGLYQIASAVDGCALGAGDGIGHGLALTTELHAAKLPEYTMIPRSTAHDSLCWLYNRLEQHDKLSDFLWATTLLQSMIEDSGHDIYRQIPQAVAARCEDFLWVWKHKAAPLKAELQRASPLQRELTWHEYQDTILLSRQTMTPLDPKRQRLAKVVRWAQQSLLDEIKNKRIVIEMNPASNLRITGAASLDKSPTVALAKEVANGLLACINTDNPGVFGSCIENEYALLLGGLTHHDMSQGEARHLLERIREIGMHLVY